MRIPGEKSDHAIDRTNREVDVVILGGGPAGAATALALRQRLRTVIILERSSDHATRVGETLPPEVRSPLVSLGVWDRFLGDEPLSSPGTISAWGDSRLVEQDFLFNPHGNGWHVDRKAFDAMLDNAVLDAGGSMLDSARLTSLSRVTHAKWNVEAVVRGAPVRYRASVVVDATGRSATIARRLGAHRIVNDRLVGLVSFSAPRERTDDLDRRALVEAVEAGWWYSALLPGGRHVAAFMTDGALLPRRCVPSSAFWNHWLDHARFTRSRLRAAKFPAKPRVFLAASCCLDRVAGDDWLAVGDAAACVDPLSSQGIYRAMVSGIEAARAIDSRLQGDPSALDSFATWSAAAFEDYRTIKTAYYRQERRWPNSPFWLRRRTS